MFVHDAAFQTLKKEVDLDLPIELICGDDFADPERVIDFLDPAPGLEQINLDLNRDQSQSSSVPAGTPDAFACLYIAELLTAEQEHHLFRKMNYLKYLAEQVRKEIQQPSKKRLKRNSKSKHSTLHNYLQEAMAIRNYIITANLRLVISIAKKLVDVNNPLEDLFAQGTVPLIRSVEIFDFERGTRFSTYATWAVRNHLYRVTGKTRKHYQKFVSGDTGYFDSCSDDRAGRRTSQTTQTHVYGLLRSVIDKLSHRDQIIISERFGLFNTESAPKTFREIGLSLGISTERVRQLLHRSLEILQGYLEEKDYEWTL